jgi:predicted secreted protein
MTFTTSILLYVMIWVVVLFLVLPWGVRIPENPQKGHATSAPEQAKMGLRLLVTSVCSLLLWIIAFLILKK